MSSLLDGSIHGINYEGRWFWVQALKLLDPQENVERVVIEANDVGGFDTDAGHFDDVVVHYNASKKDENGQPLSSDYYQVKFQMRGEGLTWKNLGASSSKEGCNCILHKLKEVVQQPHPPLHRRRFTLFTISRRLPKASGTSSPCRG